MANSLLDLLIQKCESHRDYGRYTELFNRLDPSAPPQIELVHRAAPPILKCGKKLGIFSGSFNPLTLAHTQMAKETITKYQLDELLLLLAKANVDKSSIRFTACCAALDCQEIRGKPTRVFRRCIKPRQVY